MQQIRSLLAKAGRDGRPKNKPLLQIRSLWPRLASLLEQSETYVFLLLKLCFTMFEMYLKKKKLP